MLERILNISLSLDYTKWEKFNKRVLSYSYSIETTLYTCTCRANISGADIELDLTMIFHEQSRPFRISFESTTTNVLVVVTEHGFKEGTPPPTVPRSRVFHRQLNAHYMQ